MRELSARSDSIELKDDTSNVLQKLMASKQMHMTLKQTPTGLHDSSSAMQMVKN
tara:strand:- start:763 stop:924 length:162 start_codon:yes stop_codon:yes gene_type:complete